MIGFKSFSFVSAVKWSLLFGVSSVILLVSGISLNILSKPSLFNIWKIASYNLYRYGLPRTCCIYKEYNLQIVFCIDADRNLSMQIVVCIYADCILCQCRQTIITSSVTFLFVCPESTAFWMPELTNLWFKTNAIS